MEGSECVRNEKRLSSRLGGNVSVCGGKEACEMDSLLRLLKILVRMLA